LLAPRVPGSATQERYKTDTVTAKQLSIIFEPLATGFASSKSNIVRLRSDTRIYNNVYPDNGKLGSQGIALSTKSSLGKDWLKPGVEIESTNKYIFSENVSEGKDIYFFSKSLEMPWQISELIFMSAEDYCFKDYPNFVEEEVGGLQLQNIKLGDCSGAVDEINVCFGSGSVGCNMIVKGTCIGFECDYELEEYTYGFVQKGDDKLYFADEGLMYASIFSSPKIYNGNVERLMKRLSAQSKLIESEAASLIEMCGDSIAIGLVRFRSVVNSFSKIEEIMSVKLAADELNEINQNVDCRLW